MLRCEEAGRRARALGAANLAVDTVNQAMVTAMIELSRGLRFRIVAEQSRMSITPGPGQIDPL
jgi:hypothetical protein